MKVLHTQQFVHYCTRNRCFGGVAHATIITLLHTQQVLWRCCTRNNYHTVAHATGALEMLHTQRLSCCCTRDRCSGGVAHATIIMLLHTRQVLWRCCTRDDYHTVAHATGTMEVFRAHWYYTAVRVMYYAAAFTSITPIHWFAYPARSYSIARMLITELFDLYTHTYYAHIFIYTDMHIYPYIYTCTGLFVMVPWRICGWVGWG